MAPGSWALRVSTSEFVRRQTTLLVPFQGTCVLKQLTQG